MTSTIAHRGKAATLLWLRDPTGPAGAGNSNGPFVLFGSRGLSLLDPSSDDVKPPLPAYAELMLEQAAKEEQERRKDPGYVPLPAPEGARDWDLAMSPGTCISLLESLTEDQIFDVYVSGPTHHVMLGIRLERTDGEDEDMDGTGTHSSPSIVHLLNIELDLPRAAYNLRERPSDPSSTRMIIELTSRNPAKPVASVPLPGPLSNQLALVAPLQVQFAIKRSHVHFPIKWRYHMEVLHHLLANFQDKLSWDLDGDLAQLADSRREEAVSLRGEEPGEHINLNVTNDDFFRDRTALALDRKFDHDAIHELVAYTPNSPLYLRFKKDPSKALLSKSLFEAAPFSVQKRLVREECMAIALERYLLPGRLPPERDGEAYWLALERVCTTLAKGWFREFACRWYPSLKELDRDLAGDVDTILHLRPQDFTLPPPKQDPEPPALQARPSDLLPLSLICTDPHLLSDDWLDELSNLLRHSKVALDIQTKTRRHLLINFRKGLGEPVVMMELDEEMTVAGWDGKNGRGSYEIKVKLGGQNLLMGTIQRVVGSERVWDDSGCEWAGGGSWSWNNYTDETPSGIQAHMIRPEAKAALLPPGSTLPQSLLVSVLLGTTESFCVKNAAVMRILGFNTKFPWPTYLPKNLAHLWARQNPEVFFADGIALGMESLDLCWVPWTSPRKESLLKALENEAEIDSPIASIKVGAIPPGEARDRFLEAISELQNLSQVTIYTRWTMPGTKKMGVLLPDRLASRRDVAEGEEVAVFVQAVKDVIGEGKVTVV